MKNNLEYKKKVADWIGRQYETGNETFPRILRFNDLYDLLHEGIGHFWFIKRDGTLRSAYGTLVMDIIARHGGVPEDKEKEDRPFNGNVSYFALEKDAWRCFKADSIKEIDFHYGESM